MEASLSTCISLFVSLPLSNYQIENTTSSRSSLLLIIFGSLLGFPKELLQGTLEAIFEPHLHSWVTTHPLSWDLQSKLKACSLLVARLSSSSITGEFINLNTLEKTIENDIIPPESLKIIKRSLEHITKSVYGSTPCIFHDVKNIITNLSTESEDFTRIQLEILKLNVIADDSCLLAHGKYILELLESCTNNDPSLKSKLYIYDHDKLMNINNSFMSARSTVTNI